MTAQEIAQEAARILGTSAKGWHALSGGDLSQVVRARLAGRGEVIAKTGPDPVAEGDMLKAIRAAGVPAPAVLGASDRVLVLELVRHGGALDARGWEELGAAVRRLHDHTGDGYGWSRDHAFGAVPIPNAWSSDWPAFWAERRLLSGAGALPVKYARRIEALARSLPDRLPAHPPPALLHGDLWSGNVLAARGRFAGLIDPACYRGDGEVDLAMLHLFGAPARVSTGATGRWRPVPANGGRSISFGRPSCMCACSARATWGCWTGCCGPRASDAVHSG